MGMKEAIHFPRAMGKMGGGLLLVLWLVLSPWAVGCQAETASTSRDALNALQDRFIQIAKEVGPAVVSISTENVRKGRLRRYRFGSPFEDDLFSEFFRDFFGDLPDLEFHQRGLGSGVIIDPEGHILTNEHVVQGADRITVTLPDGREFPGEIRGTDPRSDLAVVKIKAKDLPVVKLGDSDQVKSGQWVVAFGNPFAWALGGSEPTMTVGVISALHRSLRLGRSERNYSDLIQTDAAINPGNSGGPLVDLDGRVIGINVAIVSTTGGYQGIGFAIPINTAKTILADLIEGKKVLYGWLGINIQDVTADLAQAFQLPDAQGVIVARVIPDSPAQKGGVQDGDVILRFNGEPVKDVRDLLKRMSQIRVGEKVTLRVIRDGKERDLKVEVGERPSDLESLEAGVEGGWRGLEVGRLTPQLAERYGHPFDEGVIVTHIEPGSSADRSGLRVGDLIIEINRYPVRSVQDFSKAVSRVKGDALVKTTRGFFVIKSEG
jgi:serine protease Do